MPTTTFFNLPPPKKERFLRAAVTEFAQKPFNEVSINRIIQAAEVSRGSFYQYFTDKTDLFHYILGRFGQQLEKSIFSSLDASGGDLLEAPLVLFDLVLDSVQTNEPDFQTFRSIIRQNVSMDLCQLWDFKSITQAVLGRADLSHLAITGREEQLALLDLLLSSTVQALTAASCGKLALEESRKRLASKIEIIRRGAQVKCESRVEQ